MGFRIDEIGLVDTRGGPRWRIHFKGLGGKGVYATFYSGTDGRGLFTFDPLEVGPDVTPVPDSAHFFVDPAGSAEEVEATVAAWMMLQSWGPEFDRSHRVVQRQPLVQLINSDDGSGVFLKFAPMLLKLLGWAKAQMLEVTVKQGVLNLMAIDNAVPSKEAPPEE